MRASTSERTWRLDRRAHQTGDCGVAGLSTWYLVQDLILRECSFTKGLLHEVTDLVLLGQTGPVG